MPYWDGSPVGNDQAFDSVGVCIIELREWLNHHIEQLAETEKSKEQPIIAILICIRLLKERFPNCSGFRIDSYRRAKASFEEWWRRSKMNVPKKYREQVLKEAEKEFEIWETKIFPPKK